MRGQILIYQRWYEEEAAGLQEIKTVSSQLCISKCVISYSQPAGGGKKPKVVLVIVYMHHVLYSSIGVLSGV